MLVLGVVAVGVVGVGGVRHVGRQAGRAGQRPVQAPRGRRPGRAPSARAALGSIDDAAPRSDVEPTSSWSNRQTTRHGPARPAPPATSARASTAAQHDARLSSRAEPISSSSRPTSAPGRQVVEHQVPAEDVVGVDAELVGHEPGEPGGAGGGAPRLRRRLEAPEGGEVLLGVDEQPLVFTSRSRWMASWGMAHTGRSMRSRRTAAPLPLRRTATRPDSPRSRSSQLLSSTPP